MNVSENLPPVNAHFAEIAEACRPELQTKEEGPRRIVRAEKDESAVLGWRAVECEKEKGGENMPVLFAGDRVILDFGGHQTGYLRFNLVPYKQHIEPNDSPCRLRIIFGEILNDVADPLEPYNSWLSRAWLPDEIITVDYLPQPVEIPRRHAFRFVKIEVIATSRNYGVRIENAIATAVSSAPHSDPAPLSFTKNGSSLSEEDKTKLRKIDEVALRTLRNCMLTVYEDGPRRDMRLWIGDLRLQALTNYITFNDHLLAKRCLYIFAATPFLASGLLSASAFEKPKLLSGGQSIRDFTQLYAAALRDYVVASGDKETGRELFDVAKRQFELSLKHVGEKGIYVMNDRDPQERDDTGEKLWHFIDWKPELDKSTASHCVIVFGLHALNDLAKHLSLPAPTISVPFSSDPLTLDKIIDHLTVSARTHLYSSDKSAFISGPSAQISWASNAWAVVAEIPETQEIAAKALTVAYETPGSVIGNTPYLHHYLVEGMIKAGLNDLALKHILGYWGSMVDAGAETFWEAWDPENPRGSPYGDFHSNSFCHAWSCTPSLLLRQLGFE